MAIFLFAVLIFFASGETYAARGVTLAWDPPITELVIAGYKIYYDTVSGEPYNNTIDVPLSTPGFDPDNPEYTITVPDDNENYFFAVTTYDTDGVESGRLREVCVLGLNNIDPPYTKGWAITSGDHQGFMVHYNDLDSPTLGPSSEIPPLILTDFSPLGIALNLETQPPGDPFNPDVKIFIPCPGYSDTSLDSHVSFLS